MSLTALGAGFRRGLGQLKRQIPIQVLAALSLAVAFSLAGLAWAVHLHIERLTSQAWGQVRLVVFLKPAPPRELDAVAKAVSGWPEVTAVRSVSSKEALERVADILGRDKGLLAGLGPEAMPPLIELKLTPEAASPENLAGLKKRLEKLKGVDEAAFSLGWAKRLESWTRWLNRLGLGLAGALTLAGLFITYAAVRLTFLARTEEITVLRLIGASGWFIRGPYLIQGALQGLGAAVIAVLLLSAYQAVLDIGLAEGPLKIELINWALALKLLAVGTGVGLIGAWLGLGRLTPWRR